MQILVRWPINADHFGSITKVRGLIDPSTDKTRDPIGVIDPIDPSSSVAFIVDHATFVCLFNLSLTD